MKPTDRLSDHFTLGEMLRSQAATRLGYDEQFDPPRAVVENLRALCVNVLQPLRESLGVSLRVSSGYRCPRVNAAIGGSGTSQHVMGQAADIEALGVSNRELLERIIALKLPYDQLISEFEDEQGEAAWIHVSFGPRNRRQILRAIRDKGRTRYVSGLG